MKNQKLVIVAVLAALTTLTTQPAQKELADILHGLAGEQQQDGRGVDPDIGQIGAWAGISDIIKGYSKGLTDADKKILSDFISFFKKRGPTEPIIQAIDDFYNANIKNNPGIDINTFVVLEGSDGSKSTPMNPLTASLRDYTKSEDLLNWLFKNVPNIDVNAKDNELKLSPLHYAVLFNNPNAFKILLGKNANINAQDSEGNTPLHLAIQNKYFAYAQFIIEKGGDKTLKNLDGQTPLELLEKAQSDEPNPKVKSLIGAAIAATSEITGPVPASPRASDSDLMQSLINLAEALTAVETTLGE